MTTTTQRFRVRLRRAARLAAQLTELFDFLGFTFLAQLARAVFLAALVALLLVDLLVRTTLHLTVLTFRFLGARLARLARAVVALSLALALSGILLCGFEMDANIKPSVYRAHVWL
ncbi:hypothetical protein [Aliidiomarina quisquiliarum]|uniref:hypothetical protein n=1 Tax=Aliidiomarina quisquiliarum TaxID=2938947 RepID=UPI00208EEB29|nr:hypothetical protein [Aliidiomarina quisquiliarum]MCO4319964.1 hypothetical protein [Aliidiomarina quisquiliarum]